MESPKRAVEVTLRISGDSDEDILHALKEIQTDMVLRHDPPVITPGISAGYSASWFTEVSRHPEQTHDKWYAELQACVAEIDAAKAKEAP